LLLLEGPNDEGLNIIGDAGKKMMKYQKAKQHKRAKVSSFSFLDEMELLETPVQLIKEEQDWALVASLNKPPKTL